MKRQTKRFLLYVALFVLTHSVALIVSSRDVVTYGSFMYFILAVCPILIVPLAFGLMIRSWRQFLIYFLVTVLGWQLSFVVFDWVMGRLSDPVWLKDREGTWGAEILERCIVPVFFISIGAITARLRRTPRLR